MNANPIEELRLIREHLARCKNYYHRLERGYQKADLFRSLVSFAEALKMFLVSKLVGRQKMEVESAVEGMLQSLNRVEDVKTYTGGGFKYQRGAPKVLLVHLLKVIKIMQEDLAKESYESARERKLKIDQLIGLSRKRLAEERFTEAENSFQEAANLYVDEHMLFSVIGSYYLQADRPKDALRYLERAMDVAPDHEQTYQWSAEAYGKLGNSEQAADCLRRGLRRLGSSVELHMGLAELCRDMNNLHEAREEAAKALELQPQLIRAKKLLADLERRKGRAG